MIVINTFCATKSMIIDSFIMLPGCLTTKAAGTWPASSSGYLQSVFLDETYEAELCTHVSFVGCIIYLFLKVSQLHQQWPDVIATDLPVLLEQPARYIVIR